MAKGNLFLGTARGKLGSVVFYRTNGEQKSRLRVTEVKNPKTNSQYLQRIVLSQTAQAYSKMQALCNHAFQGYSGNAQNQARFLKLNLPYARVAAIAQSGGKNEANWNFLSKENSRDYLPVCSWVISEGTIQTGFQIAPYTDGGTIKTRIATNSGDAPNISGSYQDFADSIGAMEGDQLTFVTFQCDLATDGTALANNIAGAAYGISYARVILSPSSGRMSDNFLASDGTINLPNSRNLGSVSLASLGEAVTENGVIATVNGIDASTHGLGLIVSRKSSGGVWQRSNAVLGQASSNVFDFASTYPEIVASYKTDSESLASDVYLNNATD